MSEFKITRIYTDNDGDTHFEDLNMPLHSNGDIGFLSDEVPVKSVIFREVAPNYDYDFHTAPKRQYIVLLDGSIEIETSLGELRNFASGDILLVEDITGKGHKTRNLENKARRSIFITLE